MSNTDERLLEARIADALTKLGYPAPESGMTMLVAMGRIADALEDLPLRMPASDPLWTGKPIPLEKVEEALVKARGEA